MKVSDFNEEEIIEKITQIIGYWGEGVLTGSDDAVSFHLRGDKKSENSMDTLVLNTDMLVSTTDIPSEMNLFQAGKKAVVMTISDLYVKGVIPKAILVSLGLPSQLPIEGKEGLEGLIEGITEACKEHALLYLGGDLNETKELILSITAFGFINKQQIIPRKNARVNDDIWVTGNFGMTGLGFWYCLKEYEEKRRRKKEELSREDWKGLIQHRNNALNYVLYPKVDKEIGPKMAENQWARASADSSDGLFRTLKELCKASHIGCEIYWDLIPMGKEFSQLMKLGKFDLEEQIKFVFFGGEEFGHVFIASPKYRKKIKETFKDKIHYIGKTIKNNEIVLVMNREKNEKQVINLQGFGAGFLHFNNS